MKKVYDWDINVTVSIPESKKNFQFTLSIHTTIKEINTRLAQKLNLDPFVTNFSFFHKYGYTTLSPQSTLQQNRITKNDVLLAKYTLIPGKPRNPKDEMSIKRFRTASAYGSRQEKELSLSNYEKGEYNDK